MRQLRFIHTTATPTINHLLFLLGWKRVECGCLWCARISHTFIGDAFLSNIIGHWRMRRSFIFLWIGTLSTGTCCFVRIYLAGQWIVELGIRFVMWIMIFVFWTIVRQCKDFFFFFFLPQKSRLYLFNNICFILTTF